MDVLARMGAGRERSGGGVMTAVLPTRAEAVDLLARLDELKAEKSAITKEHDRVAGQLRQWMELEGEVALDDGERGITARLQERNKTPEYDVTRLDDGLVARLAKIPGLLKVNHAAVKALGDTSMDLADLRRVEMPGGITVALVVGRKDERRNGGSA